MVETCEHCRFYRPINYRDAVRCCRFPPFRSSSAAMQEEGEFLVVGKNLWCGEWKLVSGDETGDSYGDSPDGHVTSLGGSNT